MWNNVESETARNFRSLKFFYYRSRRLKSQKQTHTEIGIIDSVFRLIYLAVFIEEKKRNGKMVEMSEVEHFGSIRKHFHVYVSAILERL